MGRRRRLWGQEDDREGTRTERSRRGPNRRKRGHKKRRTRKRSGGNTCTDGIKFYYPSNDNENEIGRGEGLVPLGRLS